MDLQARFRQFSNEMGLVPNTTLTLLAVSGGVDSMVMSHLFRASGLTFGIAHCNFQLRTEASDGDEVFVRTIAEDWGVPFFTKRFDTKIYAEAAGISTQMAARNLRYEWFYEIAESAKYPFIATAHNLNDSVETTLLNFVRGSGLAGMTGIRNSTVDLDANRAGSNFQMPSSTNHISLLRPLLFATRAEILEYALAHNISWREDSSNASDDYARNFLRHHIVPVMEKLNPNFLHTAERNLIKLKETKDNLDFLTKQYLGITYEYSGNVLKSYSIDKQKLAQLPAPRRVLRELLKSQGFTEEQTRQLAENLDHVGFELLSGTGWQLLCDRTMLLVRNLTSVDGVAVQHSEAAIQIQEDDLMRRLPDGKTVFFMQTDATPPFPDGVDAVMVDRGKIQFPLTLRHWSEGDSFQPFGMVGQTQKLQDFFTNQKLSRIEKAQVWLLCNGDGAIIWVLGLRLDERFSIREGTERGLKINFREVTFAA